MKTLMIMAGGTGGHVYPALAVAEYLSQRGVNIVWLGTRNGLEARTVPDAGFDIEWINIKGLRGSGWTHKLKMPFQLIGAMLQSMRAIKRRRPNALLGMGGFVSGPGGLVAWLMHVPLLVHEQNSVAGMTNRYLAHVAKRVMTGFPNVLTKNRSTHWVGNPVRSSIVASAENKALSIRENDEFRVLVIGGSQGAQFLNENIPDVIAEFSESGIKTIHQCGLGNRDHVVSRYHQKSIDAGVQEFIDDMAEAYDWCDIVICRAGAMTVSEIAAAGITAVFVPYPYAVSNHQTTNAEFLVSRNAGFIVQQSPNFTDDLVQLISRLRTDRDQLRDIAARALQAAKPNATQDVAQHCLEVLHA